MEAGGKIENTGPSEALPDIGNQIDPWESGRQHVVSFWRNSEHSQEYIDDSLGGNEGKRHTYDNNGGDEMGHVAGGLLEFLERIVPQFLTSSAKRIG